MKTDRIKMEDEKDLQEYRREKNRNLTYITEDEL